MCYLNVCIAFFATRCDDGSIKLSGSEGRATAVASINYRRSFVLHQSTKESVIHESSSSEH